MNKIKLLSLTLTMLFVIGLLCAEDIDNNYKYGFQSLKTILSPDMAAQGGTGAFYSTSAGIVFNDPVASLNNKSKNLSISQLNNQHFGVNHINVAWRNSGLKHSWGVGFSSLDYGKIDERLEDGSLVGEYHPLDINLAVNYGLRLNSSHLAGITVHGLYSKIYTASTIGTSFDVGYAYLTPIKDLNISLNAKNFGFTDKSKNEKIDIPYSIESGINYLYSLNDLAKINSEFKLIKNQDDKDMSMAIGAQLSVYDMLYLRTGFKNTNDIEGLSTGIGVKWHQYQIDYSYNPVKDDSFGNIHYIGLSWYY